MKEGQHASTSQASKRTGPEGSALQVICLGSGGGPSEDNATGLLVRSTSSKWAKGSLLAVDAGSHLAAITTILAKDFPLVSGQKDGRETQKPGHELDSAEADSTNNLSSESRASSEESDLTVLESGPFVGLGFPHASARANAVHVVREHVSTYLITHPHLDHLSGFIINTAAFHNTSRPKRLAALPFTVNAIKNHIFNDVIWPNLTDEDNGVGFVTFQRLAEGGNLALGEGESRGYIEVCEGLAVLAYKVSHGKCASAAPNSTLDQARRASIPNIQDPAWQAHGHSHNQTHNGSVKTPVSDIHARRASVLSMHSQPGTPTFYSQQSTTGAVPTEQATCIVDSSAFFIRDEPSGKEVLIFGDVEPDSVSLYPRTHIVWAEAALKIVQGHLAGIFIECSYSDCQPDAVLFGHLAPRHLVAELIVLADMVSEKRRTTQSGKVDGDRSKTGLKRKRKSLGGGVPSPQPVDDLITTPGKRSRSRNSAHALALRAASPLPEEETPDTPMAESNTPTPGGDSATEHIPTSASGRGAQASSSKQRDIIDFESPTRTRFAPEPSPGSRENPLKGLRVVVIHVKDNMADGPLVGETILQELLEYEEQLATQGRALGCSFEVSKKGESFWF